MADFDIAIEVVLSNEGSALVEDLSDPGGLSRWGISQRSFPSVDIRTLTLDQAKNLYKENYWKYDGIVSQALANKLFDAAVNTGHEAIKIMQRLVGAEDDGVYGKDTERLINLSDPVRTLSNFRIALVQYYIEVATKNPEETKFLEGWLRRARQ